MYIYNEYGFFTYTIKCNRVIALINLSMVIAIFLVLIHIMKININKINLGIPTTFSI